MATANNFNSYIAPWVIGCPAPVISQVLTRVLIEFCADSQLWYAEPDPEPVVPDTSSYALTLPSNSALNEVVDLFVDGIRLTPTDIGSLTREYGDWLADTGSPKRYFLNNDGEVRLYPIPDTTGTITSIVSLVPMRSATSFPDFLFNDWADEISGGVLSVLMAMPGVAWANPALAAYHASRFSAAKDKARAQSLHSSVKSALTVAPRTFGG